VRQLSVDDLIFCLGKFIVGIGKKASFVIANLY
jgi:hypothetical protein